VSLNTTAVLDSVVSHALALGIFEAVNVHEPKSAPGNGLWAAVWVQDIGPVPGGSGLGSTSARVEYTVRLYTNMLMEPQDAIDPALIGAVDTLMTAYSGDFDLNASVRCVDLLGQAGVPLSARAGYLTVDSKAYRIMDITLPLIINDAWSQA
jgi:hypothetical protein